MKNAWLIFAGDVRRVLRDPLGLLVVVGLVAAPALYAWFNIAGTWDPYANTGGLTVAVANNDEGYESDLIPTQIHAGNQVVAQLHENNQFNWRFVSESQAVEGVRSGEYYAALVIPKNFSASLMTLFSPNMDPARITYYTNEKENAIAPHVTQQGAQGVQQKIDETFSQTIDQVALTSLANIASFLDGENVGAYAASLSRSLQFSADDAREAAAQAASFGTLVGGAASLVDATAHLANDVGTDAEAAGADGESALDAANTGIRNAQSALDSAHGALDTALAQASSGFSNLQDSIDAALDAPAGAAADTAAILHAAAKDVQDIAAGYASVRDALAQIDPTSPAVAQLNRAIELQESLQVRLQQAAASLEDAGAQTTEQAQQIRDALSQAKAQTTEANTQLANTLTQQADVLATELAHASTAADSLARDVGNAASNAADASTALAAQLSAAQGALQETAEALIGAANNLESAKDKVDQALASGDLERVRSVIGSNPTATAQLLAAPVQLERHAVFPIANTGSAMAPFYTTLGLWVGCVLLAALSRAQVSRQRMATLQNPHPWQAYLGRFGIFALVALAQALLVCAGDVLFMNIQCTHPWLFLLAGAVCGLVFGNLMYTLVSLLGNVGKAAAVVLLVMQIAGSGGIFPVQMSAPFFQEVYPFLPFTHAMAAFSDCVAGYEGTTYWVSLGKLALFAVPSLMLGLFLQTPAARLNRFVARKLEETNVL